MENFQRILLVEDDERDRELTLTALGEHGLANPVDVARDGEEALDYLRCQGTFVNRPPGHPALVLLDLKMPKVNGLEVLRHIKSDPALKGIPVVALTASREGHDMLHSYQSGVDAYVVKPVDFDQFIKAIRKMGFFLAVLGKPSPR